MDYTCGNCGASIDDLTVGVCQECGEEYEPIGDPIPWEERDSLGFFSALIATWLLSMFKPTQFFRRMQSGGGLASPLVYAYIMGVVGLWFVIGWELLLFNFPVEGFAASEGTRLSPEMLVVVGVFAMFLIPIGLIIGAGIVHLSLMIVGGNNTDFETTFRVVCYSSGPNLFAAVPFCGQIVGGIWSIVIEVIGLREKNMISPGRALLAVSLPMLLVCFCGFLFVLAGMQVTP